MKFSSLIVGLEMPLSARRVAGGFTPESPTSGVLCLALAGLARGLRKLGDLSDPTGPWGLVLVLCVLTPVFPRLEVDGFEVSLAGLAAGLFGDVSRRMGADIRPCPVVEAEDCSVGRAAVEASAAKGARACGAIDAGAARLMGGAACRTGENVDIAELGLSGNRRAASEAFF